MHEEYESLGRYITNKDHLARNSEKIAVDKFSTRKVSGNFSHVAQIRIHVKTAQLWESPRSYLWKHLGGDNVWKRGNGTKIQLERIHQKNQ